MQLLFFDAFNQLKILTSDICAASNCKEKCKPSPNYKQSMVRSAAVNITIYCWGGGGGGGKFYVQ